MAEKLPKAKDPHNPTTRPSPGAGGGQGGGPSREVEKLREEIHQLRRKLGVVGGIARATAGDNPVEVLKGDAAALRAVLQFRTSSVPPGGYPPPDFHRIPDLPLDGNGGAK